MMKKIKNRFTGGIMCGGLSLNNILEKHEKWLGGEEGGEKADLRSANLSYADLRSANLSYADLSSANLRSANLRYANLSYANLRYADLRSANLSYADLSYADLSAAKNGTFPVTFGPVGKELRTGFAVIEGGNVMVRLGCFLGTDVEAIKAVSDKYGARSGYAMMVKAACKVAKERGVLNPEKGQDDEN